MTLENVSYKLKSCCWDLAKGKWSHTHTLLFWTYQSYLSSPSIWHICKRYHPRDRSKLCRSEHRKQNCSYLVELGAKTTITGMINTITPWDSCLRQWSPLGHEELSQQPMCHPYWSWRWRPLPISHGDHQTLQLQQGGWHIMQMIIIIINGSYLFKKFQIIDDKKI